MRHGPASWPPRPSRWPGARPSANPAPGSTATISSVKRRPRSMMSCAMA
ncbi:Uncharacterised protein [Bordetella pertussis]|nr:Uncharacterised protein [Bordetella pertussis]